MKERRVYRQTAPDAKKFKPGRKKAPRTRRTVLDDWSENPTTKTKRVRATSGQDYWVAGKVKGGHY